MTQPVAFQAMSDAQRSQILDEQIRKWSELDTVRVVHRVEGRSAHSAVVSKQGKGLGVGYHIGFAIMAIMTGGLGLILWIFMAFACSPNRIERFRIDVDPAGQVKKSKISAAGSQI